MEKIKVVIVANCQVRPLALLIEMMNKDIDVTKVAVVHLLTSEQEDEYSSFFNEADIIIAQIVQPNYPCEFVRTEQLRKRYGKKVKTIVNIFYEGDTPYLKNLKKDQKADNQPFGDYHFPLVFDNWRSGKEISSAVSALEKQNLSKNLQISKSSLLELKKREEDADVIISDYLINNNKKRLFYTFNHPTNDLLIEYAARILNYLKIPHIKPIDLKNEFLNQLVPFESENQHKLSINGVVKYYTTEKLVTLFYAYYDSLDLKKNLIPKVIVQYWNGTSIPNEIANLMNTWKIHNPEFKHIIFDFKRAYKYIFDNYGEEEAKLFCKAKLPAMQSDIFRVAYCLKNGGVYIDAASKCVASINDLVIKTHTLTVLRKWHGGIWNGFILSNPNDVTLNNIWQCIINNLRTEEHDNVWQATGPALFNKFCSHDVANIIEQSAAKKHFDLVNDLSHKGKEHWSNVQKKQNIYRTPTEIKDFVAKQVKNETISDKVLALIETLPLDAQQFIMQDLPRWVSHTGYLGSCAFQHFWEKRQEFRSLISYRARIAQKKFILDMNIFHEIINTVGNNNYLFVSNLYLSCEDIGPGFYIEHGFSSIVYAKKIGSNFWLNQNVTIGTGRGGNPTIGDDVRVGANSVIIGGFTVNDKVKVGAGTVLNFEVPAGSTVVSQKPRVIIED
jgi:acetyltransferase-like isoleucine patch superfamily enzyme